MAPRSEEHNLVISTASESGVEIAEGSNDDVMLHGEEGDIELGRGRLSGRRRRSSTDPPAVRGRGGGGGRSTLVSDNRSPTKRVPNHRRRSPPPGIDVSSSYQQQEEPDGMSMQSPSPKRSKRKQDPQGVRGRATMLNKFRDKLDVITCPRRQKGGKVQKEGPMTTIIPPSGDSSGVEMKLGTLSDDVVGEGTSKGKESTSTTQQQQQSSTAQQQQSPYIQQQQQQQQQQQHQIHSPARTLSPSSVGSFGKTVQINGIVPQSPPPGGEEKDDHSFNSPGELLPSKTGHSTMTSRVNNLSQRRQQPRNKQHLQSIDDGDLPVTRGVDNDNNRIMDRVYDSLETYVCQDQSTAVFRNPATGSRLGIEDRVMWERDYNSLLADQRSDGSSPIQLHKLAYPDGAPHEEVMGSFANPVPGMFCEEPTPYVPQAVDFERGGFHHTNMETGRADSVRSLTASSLTRQVQMSRSQSLLDEAYKEDLIQRLRFIKAKKRLIEAQVQGNNNGKDRGMLIPRGDEDKNGTDSSNEAKLAGSSASSTDISKGSDSSGEGSPSLKQGTGEKVKGIFGLVLGLFAAIALILIIIAFFWPTEKV